jgi:hypothetical protein
MRTSFIALCLEGNVSPAAIDDFVDEWHKNSDGVPLYRFLGMNEAEYSLWARNPDALAYIIQSRRDGIPLEKLLDDREARSRTDALSESRKKA